MTVWRPCAVSCRVTIRLSPEFMNRSLVGSGVKVARVLCTGFGGAWVLPFLVTNAKVNVSMPTLPAHVAVCKVPLTGSSRTLKMFMAAHHLVGSQLPAPIAVAKTGHGTQPGG